MSPSSISRADQGKLQAALRAWSCAPRQRIGLAIERDRLCAVVLDDLPDRRELLAQQSLPLPVALFEGAPDASAEQALVQALAGVAVDWRESYAALHVALPDAVLRGTVLELDKLPRAHAQRQDLMQWRLAQLWQREEAGLECQGSDLGADGAQHLLFAQGGDAAWLACVRRALAQAGLQAWSLNAATVHRFNAVQAQLSAEAGALLAVDADSWSLLAWEQGARLRQLTTRLRAGGTQGMASVAAEAERAIVAYVHSGSARSVGRLHLMGTRTEVQALQQALAQRLREPALALHPDAALAARHDILNEGLAPLALAAALQP